MLRMPSCGALVGARRVHRHPHLAADDLGIDVGEAEERAGVVGLDDRCTWRPPCRAPRRSPMSGVSRPSLAFSAKLVIMPPRRDSRRSRPRSVSPWKPATVPSLTSRSMSVVVLAACCRTAAGHRRFDEAAAVIDVAAHHHAQRAVGPAIGLERGLVAVGQVEDREVRRQRPRRASSTSTVPLTEAPGASITRSSKRVDCGLVDQREGRARRPARRLRPARQQIVDLRLGQVGLDRKAAVAIVRRDAAVELDRHRPAEMAPRSKPSLLRALLVEAWPGRGSSASRVARLAVIERGRNAVDLDVASDPVALVVGAHLAAARASTFWPITMRSAAKFATSMLIV